MATVPPLIKAWRRLDTDTPPFVLKEDRPALSEMMESESGFHRIKDYRAFSESDLCHSRSDSTKFHLNLFPCPYLGNVRQAKVYILTLNPGFGFIDYFALANRAFREAQINQLRQTYRNGKFPWVDPQFCWAGGFTYWFRKVRPVVFRIQEMNNCGFREALSIVSKNVATLELVPYHSASYGLSSKVFNKMESPKLMLDFVHTDIIPRAKDGDALIICARKVKEWKLERSINNVIAFKGGQARGASLNSCVDRIVRTISQ